jgi:dTMP kinase
MNDAPARGRFITLEGGEGAGKSVQARELARRLQRLEVTVVSTREPGGSPRAEALREIILSGEAARYGPAAEALLFSAARIDHIDVTIEPALTRGDWVVCDRFADSTRAYQGAASRLDHAFITRLEQIVLGSTRPDLTLILDVPAEQGLVRAAKRRSVGAVPDRFEGEGLAFHDTLRHAFLEIADEEPGRCVVIEATASEEEVADAIWDVVSRRLADFLPLEANSS